MNFSSSSDDSDDDAVVGIGKGSSSRVAQKNDDAGSRALEEEEEAGEAGLEPFHPLLKSGVFSVLALENYMDRRIPTTSCMRRLQAQTVVAETITEDATVKAALRVLKGSLSEERSLEKNEAHRALVHKVFNEFRPSQDDAALRLGELESQLDALRLADDVIGEAMMLLAMSEVSRRFIRISPTKGHDWSHRALELFEELGETHFAGIACLCVGLIALCANKSGVAAKSACKAIGHFTRIDDTGAWVHGLNCLSMAYLLRQNFRQAHAKASQALEYARSLGNQNIVNMQLDSVAFIEEYHDLVGAKDPHNCEGLWEDKSGESVLVVGRSVMFVAGDAPCTLNRFGSTRLSYERRGRTVAGELKSSGKTEKKILWDNGGMWKLIYRNRESHPIIPESFAIAKSERLRTGRKPVNLLLETLQATGVNVTATSLTPHLDLPLTKLGLNSTQMFVARTLMSQHFGQELPIQIFLDLETIGDLVAYIAGFMNPPDTEEQDT